MAVFRPLRRSRQALDAAAIDAVLARGTSGVLALRGEGTYPYAVPLSYVREGDHLYFHVARSGQKLDELRACDAASFCVIARDAIVPEEFTTYFESVIAFGHVRRVQDLSEVRHALEVLADKYAPHRTKARDAEIDAALERVVILRFALEHCTGKQAIELARQETAPASAVVQVAEVPGKDARS